MADGPEDMAVDNLEEFPMENERCFYDDYHVLAAPVYELFSVNLSCDSFTTRKTCEIYGVISIEDKSGISYNLYSREPDDAEIITPLENSISLDMPSECAVSHTWLCMRISLRDKADGAVIVDEVLGLDNVTKEDDLDRVRTGQVRGAGGSATVSYAALSAAVLALVEIIVVNNDETDGLPATANVYGSVVARCGNTYARRFPAITLFMNPPSRSSQMVSQSSIELSRDLVSVPAYSFLRIEVDLSDYHTNQPIVNGKAEFLAKAFHQYKEDIRGEDFSIQVNVQWIHPYAVEEDIKKDNVKRPKLLMDRQSLGALRSWEPFLRKHDYMGFQLLEVFTVMINSKSDSVLNICGQFKIRDSLVESLSLFNRSESNPETLTANNKTISIDGPSECLDGPEGLAMLLDVRDVQGRVVIKGNITWGIVSITFPVSWFDRRACSIIRGVNGYAAVFYTIFSRAVQALVKFSFTANGSVDVSHHVRGSIRARYNNRDYSSDYEKAYYRSVLFKESTELRSGCTIPLLKSVVAVPKYSSLIIEMDLFASSSVSGLPEEHLKDVLEFEIDPNARISPAVQGKNYRIECTVEWSKLNSLYSRAK